MLIWVQIKENKRLEYLKIEVTRVLKLSHKFLDHHLSIYKNINGIFGNKYNQIISFQ